MSETEGNNLKKSRAWLQLVIYVVVVVLAVLLINRFVLQKVEVDGPSMQNTLESGDQLFVEKMSYWFHEPEVYDIVVFHAYENNKDTLYIKRVIGVPGDYIQIKEGKVYVNEKELTDPQGEEYLYDAGFVGEGIKLGENEFFVLGDNRYASKDSRDPEVGLVKREDIVGKAFIRVWPFNKFGTMS